MSRAPIDIFQGAGAPLSEAGAEGAIRILGIADAPRSLWAMLAVETGGFGYLPDRRPKILFERHVFSKRTQGAFDATYPDISNPVRGGYSGGIAEYGRLKRAMLLDKQSALESASWGLGQIMGYHAASLGYAGAEEMIEDFKASEDKQIQGCANFIKANSALWSALKGQKWDRFAFFYNGAGYAKKAYDKQLANWVNDTQNKLIPDLGIREGQALLTYLGYDTKGIDGLSGPATQKSVTDFRAKYGLGMGGLDDPTKAKLREVIGLLILP